MDIYSSVVNFFQDGGVFMYPIVVVFAFGRSDRRRALGLSDARNDQQQEPVESGDAVHTGQASSMRPSTWHRKSKAAIATVLGYGLKRSATAKRRDDIEKAMEESLMEVMPRLEKRTHYLATFANIATLAGSARHDYRSDPRLYSGFRRQSGRES